MYIQNVTSPSAIEQISSMINRYNQLSNDIKDLELLQRKKDQEVFRLKKQMTLELADLRLQVETFKELLERAEKFRNSAGRDFKQIIKTDSINRLSRRIDSIDFENKISREEFSHLIDRQ